MILGSVVDCLITTPERFEQTYLVHEKVSRASNAGKAAWEGLLASAKAENKTLLSQDIYETAKIVYDALMNSKEASPFLNNIRHKQRQLRWTNRQTGLPCIGYSDFDCVIEDQVFIVDLKVMNSADPLEFEYAMKKFEYFLQVGAYLDAYKTKFFEFPYFVFLVAESVAPFNVSVNFVEAKYCEFGLEEWLGTLKAFKICMDDMMFDAGYEFRLMKTGEYFGLHVPGYMKRMYGSFDL
jgi:hypothetical protein